MGKRWRGKPPTAAQVEARALVVRERHRVRRFVRGHVELADDVPELHWEWDEEALARERRLDGYHVLYTALLEASPTDVLSRYEPQILTERRFSDWKGPLRVRPVFLNTPQRIAALILLLHLALLIYCLLEREARRLLAARGMTKYPRLPAGHVDAVPTGENILRLFQNLLLVIEEGQHGRSCWVNFHTREQEGLWSFLGVQTPAGWTAV